MSLLSRQSDIASTGQRRTQKRLDGEAAGARGEAADGADEVSRLLQQNSLARHWARDWLALALTQEEDNSLASPQAPPTASNSRRGLSRLRDRPQLRLRANKLPSPNHCESRDFLLVF